MSTLENTIGEEKLYEAFEKAMTEDHELRGMIAYKFLSPMDFYRFCKEDAWDNLDLDQVYREILEAFYDVEGRCYDIRDLCERAFGIYI